MEFIPILAARISAMALLAGYAYVKHAERVFEIQKKRQEIYRRLITNLTRKIDLFEQLRTDRRILQRVDQNNVEGVQALIKREYPALDQAMNEAREITALMAVYGTGDAIRACEQFNEASLASLKLEVAEVLYHRE